MNLVLFTHPQFLGIRSQILFVQSLARALGERGHRVEVRQPKARMRSLIVDGTLAKWAGYVDQYLLFPIELRAAMRSDPEDTLYVFCDQALGPWLPAAAHRPHVVHCLDLLALRSALGDIAENPTSLTGRLYQRYIRRGFRQARHFISISEHTRVDLHRFGGVTPITSEVVYLDLNHPYQPVENDDALRTLRARGLPADARRCVLHVGGGQWYKNTTGVVRIYAAFAAAAIGAGEPVPPLWIVGPPPGEALTAALVGIAAPAEVRFFSGLDADALEALYSHAVALLFPSLAEGFGWPIVEAMACGCPVITTGETPMTEVGGDEAIYLPRLRIGDDIDAWALAGATVLRDVIRRPEAERRRAADAGRRRAARFAGAAAIDRYLSIYQRVLALHLFRDETRHEECRSDVVVRRDPP